jgi:protein-L-isoaspartate(D-aspartate) O-methyltransferase
MGRLPAADPVNPDPVKENRVTATAPAASPGQLNQLMIDAIAAAPHIGTRDPRVLDAIRAVPRHAFVPGASLADAYNPDLAVITKRDHGGRSLSCASVPSLVGAMLAQLGVRDGHRVFEAGAGTGWNAALLATLAGPGGQVTTIDIDPEITAQAAANLERAGFPGVHVATGDAGLGVPENAPYDRAIITIGSLDVPPAWFAQLKHGGRLVVPLRWRGQTQSVALVLGEDGILRSDSVFLCGFVPMTGQDWEHSAALDHGDLVHLYWDADQDISPGQLLGVLDRPKTRIDSGTTVGPMEPLDAIWVRATATDPAVCRISAEPAAVTSGLCTPVVKSRTLALAEGDSLAYLAVQRLEAPQSGFRAGAIGHGPDGAGLAERLCRHIDAWGADRAAKPSITIYPHSATQAAGAQVITREHCEMTVAY